MLVIALGLWVIVVRTLLGIPGSWQTVLLVLTGVLLAVIGFLLRGEALSRAGARPVRSERASTYTFVENTPGASSEPTPSAAHEHKEGITSLN